jgi:hypothetical protein
MVRPIITLTTDFGMRDRYVGVMKGVMLSICPDAQLVDITHEIPPQDVSAAAQVLRATVPYFPAHAIHLIVVDPGVGSERQPVALQTPLGGGVGPNNGVFGPLWQQAHSQHPDADRRAVVLTESRFWLPDISATFHGRDIFAPVAAHLAAGTTLEEFGPRLETLIGVPEPTPDWDEATHRLTGQIVSIDRFGNCISNITTALLDQLGLRSELQVHVHEHAWPLSRTYADVEPDEPLALLGSEDALEVSVRNGDASHALGITIGTPVYVERTRHN